MRIAVFDYRVVPTNPVGGCHLKMLRALADDHLFTVFSVEFDNPRPDRIRWVRVPAPLRPLPLLFVVYHLLAPVIYWLDRLRTRQRVDLVQTVESKLSFGDLAYSHFCHTSYLKKHWRSSNAGGWRGFSRYLDHRLHAMLEGFVYRIVDYVVVPSRGLAKELKSQFPVIANKVTILPNAIDLQAFVMPPAFERSSFREQLGANSSDVIFLFAALGHFERKGLPILLDALRREGLEAAKLLVVGGTADLVKHYMAWVKLAGLQSRVSFVGMQSDVRPYMWAADAFVLASTYETFSLAAFESAAASLPLITTSLHGIEEIVIDGKTGYVVERTSGQFTEAIRRFVGLSPKERAEMGRHASSAVLAYDEGSFVRRWRECYNRLANIGSLTEDPTTVQGVHQQV